MASNGNQDASKLVLLPALAVPVMVAIAVPNFIKAREKAEQLGCANNLREIQKRRTPGRPKTERLARTRQP